MRAQDALLHRGGGFADFGDRPDVREFFRPGRRYRVPGALATSMKQSTATAFHRMAVAGGRPGIMWTVRPHRMVAEAAEAATIPITTATVAAVALLPFDHLGVLTGACVHA